MRVSTIFPTSAHETFDFCLEGQNFVQIFPERLGLVDQSADIRIRPGGIYRFRHYMLNILPAMWEVEIVDWQDGVYYTDQMRKGPLAFFRHTHLCEPDGDFCRYTDRVEYRSGYGKLADQLIVRPYMRRIFLLRHQNMQKYLQP